MSEDSERRRKAAVRRLKLVLPTLFAVGFLFYAGITVYPLAGVARLPPDPLTGGRALLVWLAIASASGGLFALFGAVIVAVSAGSEEPRGASAEAAGR